MTGTQLIYLHHLIRRQNGPKPVKIQKIRLKTVTIFFFLHLKKKKIRHADRACVAVSLP